tara:strand:+ start:784 stop:1467 length:684 start_codon:yes stop_codon:yes gene_type:complete
MAKEKAIIFDAGTIINLSMNGLLDILRDLKKQFNGKFLITEDVEYETIKRPLTIKKFELGALRIKQLLDEKVLESPSSIGIKNSEIDEKTKQVLELANRTFFVRDRYLHLIDKGETSCLVLSEILTQKGIKNIISIDERTTRMLCEKPENLHKLLETKLHTKIKIKKENLPFFAKFKFIRSAELAYLAYKKGLVDLKNGVVLDALLYAVKYKGCSISREEIEEMKRL